jgi:SAM-dependent methyltransferase
VSGRQTHLTIAIKDLTMTTSATFWDKRAEGYAAQPIRNMPAYEDTLARVRRYLSPSDAVLEIGCGTGTTALKLADGVRHYTATDYAQGMIDIGVRKAAEQGADNVTFHRAGALDPGLPVHSMRCWHLTCCI